MTCLLGFVSVHINRSICNLERKKSRGLEGENMGSRDESAPHQPLLSSLVVRPSDSGGGGGGGGSDYEPGEVRRDAPPYSRPDRYPDEGSSSVYLPDLILFFGFLLHVF